MSNRWNGSRRLLDFITMFDTSPIGALVAEALIPTRDGVLTPTSTATVDPITGLVVPANTANGRDLVIGTTLISGGALRAERATTGVFAAASTSTGLASNTTAAGDYPTVRTMVEDGSTGIHAGSAAAVTLTNGVNYAISRYVRRLSGPRNATLSASDGTNSITVVFNLTTLAITPSAAGNGVNVRSSIRQFSNGWFLIQATFNSPAWGGSVTPSWGAASGTSVSYTGDSASSLLTSATQGELGEYATMPLGWDGSAGVARAAQSNSWGQSLSLTAGTVIAVGMSYGRGGTEAALANRLYDAAGTAGMFYDASVPRFSTSRTDSAPVANIITSASSPATAGVQQIAVQRFDSTSNRLTVSAITTSSAAPTMPFAAATPVFIGNRAALDRHFDGWVGLLMWNRALSDYEVSAIIGSLTIV